MKVLLFALTLLLFIAACTKNSPDKPKIDPEPTVAVLTTPAYIIASKGVYDDQIVISWPKVASATKYQVYKSDNATAGFEFFKETPDTLVTDVAGEAHVNTYYKVKVYNSAYAYSAFSNADFGFKLSKTYSLWYTFGGPGSDSGRFQRPKHIAVDRDANIYINDDSVGVMQKFNREGIYQSRFYWAPAPRGLLFLRNGDMLLTNVSPSTSSVSVFRNTYLVNRFGWFFQPDAQLQSAEEVAEDDERHIYIIDGQTNTIKKYDTAGVVLSHFEGTVKAPGQLENAYPFGITYLNNELFVTSPLNNMVRVYDKAGNFKRSWDAGALCYAIKEQGGWLFIAAKNYIIKADINGNIKEKIGVGSFAGGTATGLAVNTFGEVIATDVSLQKVLVFRR